MLSFICIALLSYSTSVESTKNIFLLAGQSNMVGEGGVVANKYWDGVIPPECEANPLILRLNKELSWEEAREPLHQDTCEVCKTCGIGPGMPFANSILKRDPSIGVIGLVPCAVGGTNISEWSQGSPLYDRLLARAQAALLNGGGVIRALLWYQGEKDTGTLENAMLYKCRLEKFFTDVRTDLGLPLLPVYQVALASGVLSDRYTDIVRQAQLETAAELPNVRCIDAKGLELEPDRLHLTTAAQVRLGTMLADAFLQDCLV